MTGATEYKEEAVPIALDPLAKAFEDFDFDQAARNLKETLVEQVGDESWAKAAHAFAIGLDWIFADIPLGSPKFAENVARRAVAWAQVINPGRPPFGGRSQAQIANAMGIAPALLSTPSADVSKQLNITNPSKKHDWRRKV